MLMCPGPLQVSQLLRKLTNIRFIVAKLRVHRRKRASDTPPHSGSPPGTPAADPSLQHSQQGRVPPPQPPATRTRHRPRHLCK